MTRSSSCRCQLSSSKLDRHDLMLMRPLSFLLCLLFCLLLSSVVRNLVPPQMLVAETTIEVRESEGERSMRTKHSKPTSLLLGPRPIDCRLHGESPDRGSKRVPAEEVGACEARRQTKDHKDCTEASETGQKISKFWVVAKFF